MVHSEEGETGVRLGVDWDGCATDVYCCDCDCCAVTVWWWQVESVGCYQEVRVVVVVVPDSLCCLRLRLLLQLQRANQTTMGIFSKALPPYSGPYLGQLSSTPSRSPN